MKAVILAGGTGTRLKPLTGYLNKHMLPVGRYPMIHYAVAKMQEAGITEIMLITGRMAAGMFIQYLGSGEELGVSLTYRIQEEAGGIAQALDLAEPFVGSGEKFVLLLGDNLFEHSLRPYAQQYERQEAGAMVLLKQVEDPHRYGVPTFGHSEGGPIITRITEKPEHPDTDYSVTGIYFYDSAVFSLIGDLAPSQRGELEITDLNNAYAQRSLLSFATLEGWWADAGTFESLHEAAHQMLGNRSSDGETEQGEGTG
ncbi:sugar phosphate nucleotidyltransferase [Paenibacillus sp. MMS18-CY102]|uniref:sugar phosphate nucleotidyltransferase n=1 Tax=Paenibacillus sp. MMS18-CY102 TaxID=2682849 RepID=UPI0013666757|nr:sugar phosphate nucleotidyltransferase [Paenibacillus sp. MMS18-CY102]MWC28657.1 NTP transferase domain-containing protein [Paenibacillus sp. MMS18-CY102]